MKVKINPIKARFENLLSEPYVRMFNALEAAYRTLINESDNLYEDGAHAQATELAVIAEKIIVRIEEIAEEVLGEREEPEGSEFEVTGQEIEQISLQDDLARAYFKWIMFEKGEHPLPYPWESREEFVETLRHIAHYHPTLSQPLDPSVTDEQLIEAAKDAYEDQLRRYGR